MKLLNTVALPNVLMAHGLQHVAIYQDGVVSTFVKNETKNTLEIQPTTYNVAGVLALGMSENGKYIVAQTATHTIRLFNGTQTSFETVGAFDIANSGHIVLVSTATNNIQVIMTVIDNYTAYVSANDRVACGEFTFIVYDKSRYYKGTYAGSALQNIGFDRNAVFATHVEKDKYVFFFAFGAVSYDSKDRTTRTLHFHRDVGMHVVANDGTYDYSYNKFKPLSDPVKLRGNPSVIPPQDFNDYTWTQMRFADGTATEEVSGVIPQIVTASVVGNKLVNTNIDTACVDKMQPPYFSATEDFSIEGWCNFTQLSAYTGAILTTDMTGVGGDGNRQFMLAVTDMGLPYFMLTPNGSGPGYVRLGNKGIGYNQDAHIAVGRVSGVLTMYLDGQIVFQGPDKVAGYRTTEFLNIRRGGVGKRWGLRLIRGASAYNGPFTPPTSLPAYVRPDYSEDVANDIVFQSTFRDATAVIDEKTGKGFTLSGTAAKTFGRLSITNTTTSRFAVDCDYFGAADFTIECVLRIPSAPTTQANAIMGQFGVDGSPGSGWLLLFDDTRSVSFWCCNAASGGATVTRINASSSLPLNVDVHLVVERVGGIITIYYDGVPKVTRVYTEPLFNAVAKRLANQWAYTASQYTMLMHNMRIAKRAMYNGNVRRTATLPKLQTPATVTVFSLFNSDGSINQSLTNTGATIEPNLITLGNNQYLSMPPDLNMVPRTKDFELEYEVFFVSVSAPVSGYSLQTPVFWGTWAAPGQPLNMESYYIHGLNLLSFATDSSPAAGQYIQHNVSLSLGQWYAVKWTRINGVLKIFLDGVEIASMAYPFDVSNDTSQPFEIGRRRGGTSGEVTWYSSMKLRKLQIKIKSGL